MPISPLTELGAVGTLLPGVWLEGGFALSDWLVPRQPVYFGVIAPGNHCHSESLRYPQRGEPFGAVEIIDSNDPRLCDG